MAVYKTDLDYEFLGRASVEEIVPYVKENFVAPRFLESPVFKFKKRQRVLAAICSMLGISPNNEQWVFLLAECDRLLCEACAGAGKTTMAQLKLVDAKITHNIPGRNILAIAYNKHAVRDMENRHADIMVRLGQMNIPELKRDREIMCDTFHAFCKQWVWDYLPEFGLDPNKKNQIVLSDSSGEPRIFMRTSCETYRGLHPDEKIFFSDGIYDALLSLYSFCHETITVDEPEAWRTSSAMNDLKEIPIPTIKSIFKLYEKLKKLKRKMDFQDMVDRMWELCQRPEFMRRLRTNYKVILVDEYQDITPAMLRILKIIMEGDESLGIPPFYEGQLICIGDGDQSIYGFRGTDPDNCIRFKDAYCNPDMVVRITSMSENRRCPTNIIDVARSIIESNDKRINKPILSIRDGGEVHVHEYSTLAGEMDMLINELKVVPSDILDDCCVCYRNNSSSYMLLVKLIEAGIPVRLSKSCYPLLSDSLSTSILGVLNMLSYPDNIEYIRRNLFKVLPKSSKFHKAAIDQLLDEEEERRKSGAEHRRFWELDYTTEYTSINGFKEAMQMLSQAYSLHRRNAEMAKYVPQVIKLIRTYYLNWIMTKGTSLADDYIAYLGDFFGQPVSYDNWMIQLKKLRDDLDKNKNHGIYLTTFHSLKGLEFSRVYAIDLNDMVFPGSDLNMSDKLTQAQKDTIENEARRLFYVTVTRAKEQLHLYFDRECPTRYIRFFKENQGIAKHYKDYLGDRSFDEQNGFLVYRPDSDDDEELSLDLDLDLDEPLDVPDADVQPSAVAKSSHFAVGGISDLISEMEQSSERLQQNLGDERYQAVKDKPHVKSLLDRIMNND